MCTTGCLPSHSQSAEVTPHHASHDDGEDDEKKVKGAELSAGGVKPLSGLTFLD